MRNLSYSLTHNQQQLNILHNINLDIYAGEHLALVGASGAGKSTLLALLAGLAQPTSGEILWRQQPFSCLNEDARAAVRAQDVALVFQSFQLLPELTALENVLLPLELKGHKYAQELALEWLAKVGLAARAQHKPQQLSGGEQQRVALARAFAVQPKVLFADEPTGNLDTATGQQIADLLFNLQHEYARASQHEPPTLIVVTHDPALAQRCQRQVVVQAGQLHAV